MDIIAAIEVASDAAGRQDISTTLSDLRLLYGLYTGGKFDIAAMEKAGTLKPAIAAVARTSALVVAMQNDKTTAPHVESLLASIG